MKISAFSLSLAGIIACGIQLYAADLPLPDMAEADEASSSQTSIRLPPFFKEMADLDNTAEPVILDKGAAPQYTPVASFDLAPMMDDYMNTDMVYTTKAGRQVRMSVTKARTCPDGSPSTECDQSDLFYFLFRAPDKMYYASAYQIANYFIKSGSKTLYLDNNQTKYVVKLDLKSTSSDMDSVMRNVISIKTDSSKTEFTMGQVMESMKRKARVLQMGGKTFYLFLGRNLNQDSDRNLIPAQGGTFIIVNSDFSTYLSISNTSITYEGVVFPSLNPNYMFRFADKDNSHFLEVFKLG